MNRNQKQIRNIVTQLQDTANNEARGTEWDESLLFTPVQALDAQYNKYAHADHIQLELSSSSESWSSSSWSLFKSSSHASLPPEISTILGSIVIALPFWVCLKMGARYLELQLSHSS